MKRRDFLQSIAGACVVAAPPTLTNATASTAASRPALPRRTLGMTGVEVTALALGGVIGMSLPPSASHDPAALAEAALDVGITYFDTAPGYNKGQSETNYGAVLARRRAEVFLATKTGSRTYDGTMRSVEQSLRRLRTDRFDLLQIHGVSAQDDLVAWDKPTGVLSALHKLREQKVTRFLGVTGHESAAKLREAIERFDFDTLLTTLNPVSRRRPFRENLLPVANSKRMGVIAMKIMGGGNGCLVAGNPLKQVLLPYHDDTDHQVAAETLIRYALGLPISVAVIGVASLAQLAANVQTVRTTQPLSAAERRELEDRLSGSHASKTGRAT